MGEFKQYTMEYDEHTVLIGFVDLKVDDGPEGKRYGVEFESFHVVTYIRGMDYDVTKAFSEKWITMFKDAFEFWWLEHYNPGRLHEQFDDEAG